MRTAHRTGNRRSAPGRRGAVGLAVALVAGLAVGSAPLPGKISEPSHVFYGAATRNGETLETAVVTARLESDGTQLASYVLGSNPAIGGAYALRIPIDSVGTRVSGTARPGDAVRFFLDGVPAGDAVVGERGVAQVFDIDTLNGGLPTVSIADLSQYEGNAGNTIFLVTVALSAAAEEDVTFKWGTTALTATGGVDYVEVPVPAGAPNGTIAAGNTTTQLSVTVLGETFQEDNETFLINLSSLSPNATFFDPQATITILDDDRPPAISIADVQVVEGDSGTVDAVFQLTTTRPIAQAVTVNYATADGTATTANADYQSASGVATFAPATTSTTVTVHVLGDDDDEQDETFVVNLSGASANATIADSQATGTIYDDDGFLTFVEAQDFGGVGELGGVAGLAVSPNGAHLYATGQHADSVAAFARNPVNGELTFIEAVSDGDEQGGETIDGLDGASAVVVSPDGAHVYVAGYNEGAVAAFSRDIPTGQLDFLEVQKDASFGGAASGLVGPASLALSADGKHLYVASSTSNAVALFSRETNSASPDFGRLTFVGARVDGVGGVDGLGGATCVRVAPGGAHVYVAGSVDNALAIFSRDASSGVLTFVAAKFDGVGGSNGLQGVTGLAISVDGAQLYAAGAAEDALATYNRDGATGQLVFQSMFVDGVSGIDGLDGVRSVRVSFDGRFVYAAGHLDDTLAVFSRNVTTGVLAPLELHRDGFGGEDGLARVVDLAVSGDDQHIYASGLNDDAIAVFMRDSLAPAGPSTLTSPSHIPGVFSNDPTVDVVWSGAADNPGGSGLAGYSVVFDSTALTIPDSVVDVVQASDPHGTTSPPLADGTSYRFHLRACDRAGNCSLTQHLGAFFIDATAPTNPAAILSTTHLPPPTMNTARQITMSWTAGTDALSGVAGYSFFFDASASAVCDQIQDVGPATLTATSDTLEDGTWYFHLCTHDNAGNWSAAATAGPYRIEAAPPRVLLVETVAETPGTTLEEGEAVLAPITQLVVLFNEPMFDPAGNGDADDVTNPANYQVLSPGPDGAYQTGSCVAVAGDDVLLLPTAVQYDAVQRTAVALLGSRSLAKGRYRLQLCGSTSLVDLAGNALDGDGNGTGGDDHRLNFEMLTSNLLVNPNFDQSIAGWSATPPTPGAVHFDAEDADGWSVSGSALMEFTGSAPAYAVSQCVEVVDGAQYVMGGRVRIASASLTEPEVFAEVQYFQSTNCTVTPLGAEFVGAEVAGDTEDLWLDLPETLQQPPVGARSAYVSFVTQPGAVLDFDAGVDRLVFQHFADVVFVDGFETGNSSQWSNVSP